MHICKYDMISLNQSGTIFKNINIYALFYHHILFVLSSWPISSCCYELNKLYKNAIPAKTILAV